MWTTPVEILMRTCGAQGNNLNGFNDFRAEKGSSQGLDWLVCSNLRRPLRLRSRCGTCCYILGLGVKVVGSEFRVQSSGFKIDGLVLRVQGLRVRGRRFRGFG